MATEVSLLRIPIGLPCCIPVIPGTPNTDAPIEHRTETCGVDAYWMVGALPTCDVHTRLVSEIGGWDYDELEREGGGPFGNERTPWAERPRTPEPFPPTGASRA